MAWLRFATIVVLGALFTTGTVGAAPLTQVPDAETLLLRSGQAMSGIQSFRMDGTMEMSTVTRGSSVSMAFSMNGEFSTPDRAHIALDLGALGVDLEAVVIGQQAWIRSGDDAWGAVSGTTMDYMRPSTGSSFMGGPGDLGQYLRDTRVAEEGAQYRISGSIDFDRALAGITPPPDLASGLGAPTSMVMPDLSGGSASFVYLIDRVTLYPSSMVLTMALPDMPSPSRSGTSATSDATLTARIIYRDFNDPSIRIEPPV